VTLAEEQKLSESGSEEESSYYDEEEESEQEDDDDSRAKEPKTREVIDVTGNMGEKQEKDVEAYRIFEEAQTRKKLEDKFDSSKLFLKMKQEWRQLQENPSSLDAQIQAQLEMLDTINNSAFNEGINGEAVANQEEIGKMMHEMLIKGQAGSSMSVTAEFRSRGEPFQDP